MFESAAGWEMVGLQLYSGAVDDQAAARCFEEAAKIRTEAVELARDFALAWKGRRSSND